MDSEQLRIVVARQMGRLLGVSMGREHFDLNDFIDPIMVAIEDHMKELSQDVGTARLACEEGAEIVGELKARVAELEGKYLPRYVRKGEWPKPGQVVWAWNGHDYWQNTDWEIRVYDPDEPFKDLVWIPAQDRPGISDWPDQGGGACETDVTD